MKKILNICKYWIGTFLVINLISFVLFIIFGIPLATLYTTPNSFSGEVSGFLSLIIFLLCFPLLWPIGSSWFSIYCLILLSLINAIFLFKSKNYNRRLFFKSCLIQTAILWWLMFEYMCATQTSLFDR